MMRIRWFVLCLFAAAGATRLAAQAKPDDGPPLGRRAELESIVRRLQASGTDSGGRLARIRQRLAEGDFHPGDRIRLVVPRETTLTDTFTVLPDRTVQLPSPVADPFPLTGVLRSELEERATDFIRKYVIDVQGVRAEPLVRFSVEGEVLRPGPHDVPANAQLSDVLRAAGGTTNLANMRKLRIERHGKPIWKGETLNRAIAEGRTVDDVGLESGDGIVIPRIEQNTFRDNMGFLWVVVSVLGGVYGLSKVF